MDHSRGAIGGDPSNSNRHWQQHYRVTEIDAMRRQLQDDAQHVFPGTYDPGSDYDSVLPLDFALGASPLTTHNTREQASLPSLSAHHASSSSLQFLDPNQYASRFTGSPAELLQHVDNSQLPALSSMIASQLNQSHLYQKDLLQQLTQHQHQHHQQRQHHQHQHQLQHQQQHQQHPLQQRQPAHHYQIPIPHPPSPEKGKRPASGKYTKSSKLNKPPVTINWLLENYEEIEGASLPRSSLYEHYVQFCKEDSLNPVNAASFGKIIRQQFPNLKTRRLGTRGQSKYHYYGIGLKSNAKPWKKKTVFDMEKYNSSPGTTMPDPPPIDPLYLRTVAPDQLQTFLLMYKTHCQSMLDFAAKGELEQIECQLGRLWKGMPQQYHELLVHKVVVDVIVLCDDTVYEKITKLLIPQVHGVLDGKAVRNIRLFARNYPSWLSAAMAQLSPHILERRMPSASAFTLSLKRQTSLNHLSQAVQKVIASDSKQMLEDFDNVDAQMIVRQIRVVMPDLSADKILKAWPSFRELIATAKSSEAYTTWLQTIFAKITKDRFEEKAKKLVLMWSLISSKVIQEMTLQGAATFGSFHVVRVMLDEFAMHYVETRLNDKRVLNLRTSVDACAHAKPQSTSQTVDADVGFPPLHTDTGLQLSALPIGDPPFMSDSRAHMDDFVGHCLKNNDLSYHHDTGRNSSKTATPHADSPQDLFSMMH